MEIKINLSSVYKTSEEIVVREIEGELIIVPLTAGIGDMEDELFTLNETGRAIWGKLDGKKSMVKIIEKLTEEFNAPSEDIKKDVLGFAQELLKRNIIVESTGS
jgi:hypothetical protein